MIKSSEIPSEKSASLGVHRSMSPTREYSRTLTLQESRWQIKQSLQE
jgi:hypothetical protein